MLSKYGAADYVFQFITVTAGVLIALMIDGLVDWKSNRDLVAQARATIRREIDQNLTELAALSKNVSSSDAEIEKGLRVADELLATGKTAETSMSLNFNLATLNASAWQSASGTGALAHMPYDDVRKYAELYSLQELFDAQQRKAVDLVASNSALMAAALTAAKVNRQDVESLRQQLMLLQANQMVTSQLGEQLIKALQKSQIQQ